jgi:hypothetical protein
MIFHRICYERFSSRYTDVLGINGFYGCRAFPCNLIGLDIIMKKIKCYDNGGDSYDRYTIVYLDDKQKDNMYGCVGCSDNPFHPLGFGQHGICMDGNHLGKPIRFSDLPDAVQTLVNHDLGVMQ